MTGAAARPRVVHLVPALFGQGGLVGGAERYVFELARHMAERVDTRLVTFGDAPSETTNGPLTVQVLGPGASRARAAVESVFMAPPRRAARRRGRALPSAAHLATSLAAMAGATARPVRVLHGPGRWRMGHLWLRLHRPAVPRAPAHQRVQPSTSSATTRCRPRTSSTVASIARAFRRASRRPVD